MDSLVLYMGIGATSLLVAAYAFTMIEFRNLTEAEHGHLRKRKMKVRKENQNQD